MQEWLFFNDNGGRSATINCVMQPATFSAHVQYPDWEASPAGVK